MLQVAARAWHRITAPDALHHLCHLRLPAETDVTEQSYAQLFRVLQLAVQRVCMQSSHASVMLRYAAEAATAQHAYVTALYAHANSAAQRSTLFSSATGMLAHLEPAIDAQAPATQAPGSSSDAISTLCDLSQLLHKTLVCGVADAWRVLPSSCTSGEPAASTVFGDSANMAGHSHNPDERKHDTTYTPDAEHGSHQLCSEQLAAAQAEAMAAMQLLASVGAHLQVCHHFVHRS